MYIIKKGIINQSSSISMSQHQKASLSISQHKSASISIDHHKIVKVSINQHQLTSISISHINGHQSASMRLFWESKNWKTSNSEGGFFFTGACIKKCDNIKFSFSRSSMCRLSLPWLCFCKRAGEAEHSQKQRKYNIYLSIYL